MARLLESCERNRRFEAAAAAYGTSDDEALRSWRAESAEWATADADGLDS
jgi:hypothetical protein